jgi:glucose-1-phosphatase
MNQEKLVLFDLGGVVIDIDFERVWRHWSQASGVALSKTQEKLGPASSDNEAFHLFERGEIEEAEFYRRTAKRTGIEMGFEDWRAGWNSIFVGEMPGTCDLLQALQGRVRLMALSNINVPHHAFTVEHYSHLLAQFEGLIFSHKVGLRKPEKAVFDFVRKYTGLSAKNILFFDDMPINVDGARAAGLRAEMFLNAAHAKKVIDDFLNA